MRELLFRNATSLEKKRKIFSIQEVKEKKGLLTRINRKYIYILKEIQNSQDNIPSPQFYICKEYNSRERAEKLLFKVKGSFQVVNEEHVFLVYFCHSLKVALNTQVTKTHHTKN